VDIGHKAIAEVLPRFLIQLLLISGLKNAVDMKNKNKKLFCQNLLVKCIIIVEDLNVLWELV
jgi:hypothetical protein